MKFKLTAFSMLLMTTMWLGACQSPDSTSPELEETDPTEEPAGVPEEQPEESPE